MLASSDGAVGTRGRAGARPIDEIMLDEHAHRVTNDMTAAIAALQLCRRRVDEAATRTALATAIERLHHIADLQRSLSKPREGEVDLGVVLEGVSRAVVRAYAGSAPVSLSLRLDKFRAGSDFAWRLSTVLAEAVANAVRHAFAERGGSIKVTLVSRASGLCCTVADDGKGAGDWRSKGSGRGTGIIDTIVAGLGGTAVRKTSAAGTRVTMRFPSLS